MYCRPTKAAPKVDARFVNPIREMIENEPSFGYRTVAWLLGFNKNTVQRIFRIKGWQVRKRPIGMRPRIKAVPSVAMAPNERWSTELCRVWSGRDGWTILALVIDCHTRELPGWHLSRSGKSTTAASALEHALISRAGTLGKVPKEFCVRSNNGLVFTSHRYTTLVRSYGLRQEFIAPHCPQQNGMVVHPDDQGTMHSPTRFRQHSACHTRNRRLDQLLQPQAPASGAGHENHGRGIRTSGSTRANSAGSI